MTRSVRQSDWVMKSFFSNRDNPNQTITTKVVGLLRYQSFEALFAHNDFNKFGGPSVDWLLSQIREFYSPEDEQKYGVIGIEFTLAKVNS